MKTAWPLLVPIIPLTSSLLKQIILKRVDITQSEVALKYSGHFAPSVSFNSHWRARARGKLPILKEQNITNTPLLYRVKFMKKVIFFIHVQCRSIILSYFFTFGMYQMFGILILKRCIMGVYVEYRCLCRVYFPINSIHMCGFTKIELQAGPQH